MPRSCNPSSAAEDRAAALRLIGSHSLFAEVRLAVSLRRVLGRDLRVLLFSGFEVRRIETCQHRRWRGIATEFRHGGIHGGSSHAVNATMLALMATSPMVSNVSGSLH